MNIQLNKDGTVDISKASASDLKRLAEFEFGYHLEKLMEVIKPEQTDEALPVNPAKATDDVTF